MCVSRRIYLVAHFYYIIVNMVSVFFQTLYWQCYWWNSVTYCQWERLKYGKFKEFLCGTLAIHAWNDKYVQDYNLKAG